MVTIRLQMVEVVLCAKYCMQYSNDTAQTVIRQLLNAEARVRAHVNPCGICSGASGAGTEFCPNPSVSFWQYHSTVVPYTLISFGGGYRAR
jgi:hypothetical protein